MDTPRPAPRDAVLIGQGLVRHQRLRPRAHAFAHPTWFLLLPMHRLVDAAAEAGLALNRPGLIAFHDRDHGDGRGPEAGGALGWMRELLQAQGITERHAVAGAAIICGFRHRALFGGGVGKQQKVRHVFAPGLGEVDL